jgi:hypothetical protein
MLPSKTLYTDNLPADVGGCANGPLIRIRNKYRDDPGIHAHEAEHVRQWYAGVLLGVLAAAALALLPQLAAWSAWWPVALVSGFGLHPLTYRLLPRYRLWAEVRAYRIQLQHYPDDRSSKFAGFIAEKYNLNISRAEAAATLKG